MPKPSTLPSHPLAAHHQALGTWRCLLSLSGLQFLLYVVALLGALVALLGAVSFLTPRAEAATARVKDIVSIEGVRDNILVGYGLVVGLNGTGDKLNNAGFTDKSLRSFLERVGVNVSDADLKVKNVAAVTVTATLPPFARNGSRIGVTISTMGDAKSLQGGTLIATPLMGADGQAYAVAQGTVAIEGFAASGGSGSSVSKGVPTSGFIAGGAIIEQEMAFDINRLSQVKLALRNPDVTTATRMARAINRHLASDDRIEGEIARVRDPGTVELAVPHHYAQNVTALLDQVSQLSIQTDQPARIVIDEASGTVVMNENVRIDTVAIAQGNLVVTVTETPLVSQPGAFAPEGAETVEVQQSTISVDEGSNNQMAVLQSGANLKQLVAGLNALGVGPRDLISILQTIKVAGALQAEVEAR